MHFVFAFLLWFLCVICLLHVSVYKMFWRLGIVNNQVFYFAFLFKIIHFSPKIDSFSNSRAVASLQLQFGQDKLSQSFLIFFRFFSIFFISSLVFFIPRPFAKALILSLPLSHPHAGYRHSLSTLTEFSEYPEIRRAEF